MDTILIPEETREFSEAVSIFEGLRSYDVMENFMDADVETPRGARFYDPIYEEVWG